MQITPRPTGKSYRVILAVGTAELGGVTTQLTETVGVKASDPVAAAECVARVCAGRVLDVYRQDQVLA
jgi:Asp/Glu/hydantoin racemase